MLAGFSFGGYAIAYSFEVGYASHFGFPEYLISPTTSVIACALLALSAGAQVLVTVWALWQKQSSWPARMSINALCIMGVTAAAAVIFYPEDSSISIFFGVTSLLFGLVGVFMWLIHRAPGEEMKVQEKNKDSVIVSLVFAIVMLAVAAQITGMAVARNQKIFYVMSEDPSYAIVRIYGDFVVAVRFDLDSQKLTGEYIVSKFEGDDQKLLLKRKKYDKPRRITFGFSEHQLENSKK